MPKSRPCTCGIKLVTVRFGSHVQYAYNVTLVCACSGAVAADSMSYKSLKDDRDGQLPGSCVSVRCQGYETSLAECVIYDKARIGDRKVATATCYDASQAPKG